MIAKNNKSVDNLTDPMLSALLQEAFADDPALTSSPGRTDRIMRKIMSTGVRPVSRPRWTPFAWAAGACATAAVLLMLFSGGKEKAQNVVVNPPAPIVEKEPLPEPPEETVAVVPKEIPVTVPTVGKEKAVPKRVPTKYPRIEGKSGYNKLQPREVAKAYLAMADGANEMGDYATAYEAYNAAYKVEPSSITLMASANALERMVNETAAM